MSQCADVLMNLSGRPHWVNQHISTLAYWHIKKPEQDYSGLLPKPTTVTLL